MVSVSNSSFRDMLPCYIRAALHYAFVLPATRRILHLYPKPVVTGSRSLLLVKQLLVIATLAVPVTYLLLSDRPVEAFFGTFALPATLSFALVPLLSFLEHTRTAGPSMLLLLLLWAKIVDGVVQTVDLLGTGLLKRRDVLVITFVPEIFLILLAVAEGLPKQVMSKQDAMSASAKIYKL